MKQCFEFIGHGAIALPAVIWQPEQEIKAVLQINHGMTEHMGRYESLAADLCSHGIAVAGFDLRGHGKNPGNPEIASFGEGGWTASIEDMRLFFTELRSRFPGVPHFMLGFSLGSFLLREYLTKYPSEGELAGAIIAGTGHQPGWILAVIMAIVKGEFKKAGFDGTTDLIRQLSFGTYNQKFKPNRTEADWLCSDVSALDAYLADPLVRKNISAGLFRELLGSMKRSGSAFEYDGWDTSLPILLISGQEDPVGDAGKGVRTICNRMEKAGMENVTLNLPPNARHDIFHEEANGTAEAVRHCIAAWLTERF
jgi:alpha-beta hydrolase superfamily lysophospholipase